ncbi:MAG TPA: hypothetical protein PK668_04500 [Myxococcota bacterium]|nr:hypothetical protein [Myxococcota bacterium]HRY92120.1 hypothetical protein [Myxococcota bacterium]HSA22601.1 hypothetical protein [Myxococcota bacterium]
MPARDTVYCCLVEVRPQPGCELDPRQVAGAFVRCYALAEDEASAQQQIRAALAAKRFEVVEIGWTADTYHPAWEPPDPDEAERCRTWAERTRLVTHGRFDAWAPEPNDCPV